MVRSNLGRELDRFAAEVSEATNKQHPVKSTYDVYDLISPHLDKPTHLDPFIKTGDEAIIKGGVDWCFSATVQHGKTEAVKHMLIFAGLLQQERARNGDTSEAPSHAYSTFNDERARQIMNEVKVMAQKAGLQPTSSNNILTFDGGARIKFTGTIAGSLTGWPIRDRGIHIIDDPIAVRKDALSELKRNGLRSWLQDVALTRRHPGASCLIMMARWTQNDLIGWVQEMAGWPFVRIAAICDSDDDPLGRKRGELLSSRAPEGSKFRRARTHEWYDQQRKYAGELTWQSLWQGRPISEEDALFEPVQYAPVDEKGEPIYPSGPYIVGYGCDLAYEEKNRADYSVLVQGRWYLWHQQLFITRVWREQTQAPRFNAIMRTAALKEPGQIIWHTGGGEKGTAQLIAENIPNFRWIQAQGLGGPYARACPVAELMWNEPARQIFVLPKQKWTEDFVDEVETFPGSDHDDQVMALASLAENFLRGAKGGNDRGLRRQLAQRYGAGLRGRTRED